MLVRVSAGGFVGWGECEASPLPSIAAFVCPMSHGVCRPVRDSVLGKPLDNAADIAKNRRGGRIQQHGPAAGRAHLLGCRNGAVGSTRKGEGRAGLVVARLYESHKKTPYASQLFGNTPAETLEAARRARRDNFRAVKFGWGPIGRGSVKDDEDHLRAAREGLGPDGILLVDVGQIWGEDVDAAKRKAAGAGGRRVPFGSRSLSMPARSRLTGNSRKRSPRVKIAGGEAAHNASMALHLIDYGGVGYIQIDCGRIGGIGPAKKVADYAVERGVTYVNHTFTSHLALSASLQPFAGLADHRICEFPFAPKSLAKEITTSLLPRDENGEIAAPDLAGLGVEIDTAALRRYLVDVEIKVGGRTLYATPELI